MLYDQQVLSSSPVKHIPHLIFKRHLIIFFLFIRFLIWHEKQFIIREYNSQGGWVKLHLSQRLPSLGQLKWPCNPFQPHPQPALLTNKCHFFRVATPKGKNWIDALNLSCVSSMTIYPKVPCQFVDSGTLSRQHSSTTATTAVQRQQQQYNSNNS